MNTNRLTVGAELESLQRATFSYFLHETNPRNGLVRDKTAPDWPASIAATGLALAVYPVAVERGFITRAAAITTVLATLRFFWNSRQGPEPDATGCCGFYYHFVDMQTGRRAWQCELSTVDSAILFAGALTAGAYFDADTTNEKEIRNLAKALYRRADWPWTQNGGVTVTHGWKPESGFLEYRWEGYDEALVLYILGLGSPTHPLPDESYAAWASTYRWEHCYGYDYLYAGPLFTHQLSHIWIDFRGTQDAFMRAKGIDYFENSRRATYGKSEQVAVILVSSSDWNKTGQTVSQMSFGDAEYAGKRKKTRREVFLEEMNQVVPWKSLLDLIEPCYPIAGRGRHPYPLETMLRVHLMQNWFGLSDPAMEEALYEITPMRTFAGLTLTKAIPDETTILNFRHLLEANELAPEILRRVNAYLSRKGLLLKRGSIVDATIIAAPSSTKNAEGERDPEMHQTKKGNQWHFGMKAHIGVDADSGLVHTVTTTPANEADVEVVDELLHGEEEVVHADAGYTGADKRVRRKNLEWQIAAKRGRIKAMADGRAKRALERVEKAKASVRAKVEHPFRVIKRQFGLMKVRFRGLAKNTAHVITLFALSNLWMARRRLLALTG